MAGLQIEPNQGRPEERGLIMMYFKECPKCHGDLYAAEDMHGRYLSCIQCGYLRDETPGESLENTHPLDGKTFVIAAPKTAKKRQKKVAQVA